MATQDGTQRLLLCRLAEQVCGIPVEQVVETMRPLPLEPIEPRPDFVLGLCVVRGSPTPAIDLSRLCGGKPSQANRFVTIAVGSRTVALAVDDVIGLRTVENGSLAAMPPLLREASDAVTTLGVLDSELLLVLDAVRLAPEALLAAQLADVPS